MKSFFVFCLFSIGFFGFVISGFTYAQLAAGISKEEKLQQLKTRDYIRATEIEKDLLKLEFPNGKVMHKNIADFDQQPTTYYPHPTTYSPNYTITEIDLRNIDTTLYYDKYSLWKEVPVGSGPNSFVLVSDVNNNKLPELYGRKKGYNTDYSDIVVYELNNYGGFDSVYSYSNTSIAKSIYDIDKDGMSELHLRRFEDSLYPGNSYLFYRKSSIDSLAKELSFIFYYPFTPYTTQQNDNKFGDWDGDEFTDQAFHILGIGMFIFEYNPSIQNFDSVYFYDNISINREFAGFAIDDFDQDGRTEFFSGSTKGYVSCVENKGDNSYSPTWVGRVETYNAYQLAQTNDIDGNGKKEIWVGGDAFYPDIGPMTRITIFEADGDDSYHIVGRIDLVGVFSFFAQNYQAVDVDNDGIEEMMICIEQTVLILKFNGETNRQSFELFYLKKNDLALDGRNSVFYGAVMYDLTGNGIEEVIITLDDIKKNVGLKLFSQIYKPNFPAEIIVEEKDGPTSYKLYPIFPNPFNSKANIKFDITAHAMVSLKVYNVIGKEISALVEKDFPPGNYTYSWEAIDHEGRSLPSGIYFIRLSAHSKTESYSKTKKVLLLK
jgi:hypothetical protein